MSTIPVQAEEMNLCNAQYNSLVSMVSAELTSGPLGATETDVSVPMFITLP